MKTDAKSQDKRSENAGDGARRPLIRLGLGETVGRILFELFRPVFFGVYGDEQRLQRFGSRPKLIDGAALNQFAILASIDFVHAA